MTFEGDRTAGILRDSKIMNRMILLSLLFTVYLTIISNIFASVTFIPCDAISQTLSIVFSTVSFTIPSPGWNSSASIDRQCAIIAASTAVAILAAHDGLAPSQIIPDTLANVFVIVAQICSYDPPERYVIPAPARMPR